VKAERTFKFPVKIKKIGEYDIIIGGKRNQIAGKKYSVDSAETDESKIRLSTTDVHSGKLDPDVAVERIGQRHQVVFLINEKILAAGDLFYNQIHPPLKELQLPNHSVVREILQGLAEKYQPALFVPAEGEPSESFDEFVSYLADLSDQTKEYETLRAKYSHFREIVGLSSFSENFDYLRRLIP